VWEALRQQERLDIVDDLAVIAGAVSRLEDTIAAAEHGA